MYAKPAVIFAFLKKIRNKNFLSLGSSYCPKGSRVEPITERNNLNKQNKVENPNWPAVAKPVGLDKRGQGFELETTENKSS